MSPAAFALALVDPRGRCDRKGLLALAVVMLVLQVAVEASLWLADVDLASTAPTAVKLAFCWAAVAAVTKRLHDLGRSAWWMLAAFVVVVVWSFAVAFAAVMAAGPEALTPRSVWFAALFAVSSLPALAALLWLHLAKGMPGPNRFGPAPDRSGFSGPAPQSTVRLAEAVAA